MDEQKYTLKEVMEMTQVSERTLRRYLKDGLLKGFKVGGTWRFTKQQLQAFFDDKQHHNEIARQASEDVKKFLRHSYEQNDSDQGCAIFDFNNPSEETLNQIRHVVMTETKKHKGFKMKLHPEGDYIRVVLIGGFDFICDMSNAMQRIKN